MHLLCSWGIARVSEQVEEWTTVISSAIRRAIATLQLHIRDRWNWKSSPLKFWLCYRNSVSIEWSRGGPRSSASLSNTKIRAPPPPSAARSLLARFLPAFWLPSTAVLADLTNSLSLVFRSTSRAVSSSNIAEVSL